MNEIQKYSALKLPWEQVSRYVGSMVSAILDRTISCSADGEDDNYWSVVANGDTFTNVEIVRLVNAIHGDAHMLRNSLPVDSNASRSLDMDLCRALLQKALDLNWETEFVSEDALWITGHFPDDAIPPDTDQNRVYIDGKVIDLDTLMPMSEFVDELFKEGGTFTDLTNLCERYERAYGTPLYWMYPFTDGQYNGCCFVLVREGVLVLSYDEIEECDHEIFVRDSARLCDATQMQNFLTDLDLRSKALAESIQSLLSFLERKRIGSNSETNNLSNNKMERR